MLSPWCFAALSASLLVSLGTCQAPDHPPALVATAGAPPVATAGDAPRAAVDRSIGLSPDVPTTPPEAASSAEARAYAVLLALKRKDMKALAALVHPDLGVRFSPYGFVDKDSAVLLVAGEIGSALSSKKVRHWGDFDGSGDPIDLTFAGYYARFVWNVDFTKAGKRPEGFAENSVDNAAEVYGKTAKVIELYYPPSDPRSGGLDWCALRLVMEPKDGVYYLVGIIHSQWTV